MESEHNDDDDERHEEAFGDHIGISSLCRDEINHIKNNNLYVSGFSLEKHDADLFSDLAWELLGRYIAGNAQMERINLSQCGLTDSNTSILFRGLDKCIPLTDLELSANLFGIVGIQRMLPFLKRAQNILATLLISRHWNATFSHAYANLAFARTTYSASRHWKITQTLKNFGCKRAPLGSRAADL